MLHQIGNIFHLAGGSVSAKQLKILLCVSLEGEPEPCPKLHRCCLTAPLFSPHPLPFLISNCLNLPFGTQGRSWSLHETYFLQTRNWGPRKASIRRAPQSPACFHCHSIPFWHQVPGVGADTTGLSAQSQGCFHFTLQLRMGSPDYPHFCCGDYKSGVSHDLTSGTIIGWSNTELRKPLCLWWQFYFKGYNLGTAKWKRCPGQGSGVPCSPALSRFATIPACQHTHRPEFF